MRRAMALGLAWAVWVLASAYWLDQRSGLTATASAVFLIDFVSAFVFAVAVAVKWDEL